MADYVEIISMNLNDPNLRPNDGGFQSVDPGTYDFEVEKAAAGTSNAGNNTLKVTARVIGPDGSPMLNRTMMGSYVIGDTDFARGRMLALVQATGVEINAEGSFSREALIGCKFTADVEKRPGTPTVDKMGNEVVRDFTSWVRERPLGEVGTVAVSTPPSGSMQYAAAPSQPAKPAGATVPPGTARRPATPNVNGTAGKR